MKHIWIILLTILGVILIRTSFWWINKRMEKKYPFTKITTYQEWQNHMAREIKKFDKKALEKEMKNVR